MNKKILIAVLSVIILLVGLFVGKDLGRKDAEAKIEKLTINYGDRWYENPSFQQHRLLIKTLETCVVVEKIKMDKPTVVKLTRDFVVKGEDGFIYFLKKGDYYKFIDYNSYGDEALIEITSEEDKKAQVKVYKDALIPLDEGEWIRLQRENGLEAWLLVSSEWYNYQR